MASYIALLRKEARSDFGVEFPDFPGCVTAGRTLEEARRMAAEALRLHVDGLLEDGEEIPAPTPLDAIADDPANDDATAFLVDVPDPAGFVARVNVTIPKAELRTIDAYARDHGLTRSGLLTRGALQLIAGEAVRPGGPSPRKGKNPATGGQSPLRRRSARKPSALGPKRPAAKRVIPTRRKRA